MRSTIVSDWFFEFRGGAQWNCMGRRTSQVAFGEVEISGISWSVRGEMKVREKERKRAGAESQMNRCGTNAQLIYLFSSIFNSQHAATLQSPCYLKLEECACCLCVHKKVKMCIFDPDLCVYCVSVCMMPLTVCIKWLRAPEYSRGI